MKKFFKELLPAIILSLLISYNINLYEPIITYLSNVLDFWFDFNTMIKYSLFIFIITFLILIIIYSFIYFINNKYLKNRNVYKIILIISYIIYIASYIQGNYLIGNLPELNGQSINFSGHIVDNIITCVIWIGLIIGYIYCIKKYSLDKVINISKYVTCGIFGMLFISMITVMLTTENAFIKKNAIATTYDGINMASSDSNFYLLVLDATDSKRFNEVMDKGNYKFDDFTYYPDTVGENFSTRYAIPFILSGIPYKGEKNYYEYYDNSLNNSNLINNLIDNDYKLYMYEEDLEWTTGNVSKLNNYINIERKIDTYRYFVQMAKLMGLKYLPYPLKSLAKVENVDFSLCRINKGKGTFTWDDKDAYDRFNNDKLEIINDKYFNFMHLEGSHLPHNVDSNFNYSKDANYEDKLEISMKIINSLTNRLKKNNVYDNSIIVVMADHGFCEDGNDNCDRLNPLLMIKGKNEKHNFIKSDKAISYLDLSDAFIDLINNKKSTQLFSKIGNKRTRYSFNGYENDKYLVKEYYGKAWDANNSKSTSIKDYR